MISTDVVADHRAAGRAFTAAGLTGSVRERLESYVIQAHAVAPRRAARLRAAPLERRARWVTGPVPRWATAAREDDRTRPSPQHFQRFYEAVARGFGAEVYRYSVRNEPHHPRFLLPQYIDGHAASGTIYRGLYLSARRGRKAAGQSHRQLLFGETAPRGTSRVVVPLRFLRQALCLTTSGHRRHGCQELHVDAIAHHPYARRTAGPR